MCCSLPLAPSSSSCLCPSTNKPSTTSPFILRGGLGDSVEGFLSWDGEFGESNLLTSTNGGLNQQRTGRGPEISFSDLGFCGDFFPPFCFSRSLRRPSWSEFSI